MGRTIKISELKKFDVFSFRGGQFMWPGNIDEIIIVCPSLDENESLRVGCETEVEVELLGQMEFVKHGDATRDSLNRIGFRKGYSACLKHYNIVPNEDGPILSDFGDSM